jgi:hypothetical protein
MSISHEKITPSANGDLNSRFNLIQLSSVARFDDFLRSTSALIQRALPHLSSFGNAAAAVGIR